MRGSWKKLALVACVAVIGLSVVAVAYAATRGPATSAPRGGGSSLSACRALMNNPAALKAMQALRVRHQKDLQAWNAQYGADPASAAALAALAALRAEHRQDMLALFKQFGIPAGTGGCFGAPGPGASGASVAPAASGGCCGAATGAQAPQLQTY